MFETLSKELHSLKQGSGENVAEFGVHLSQQVQIFQLEYLERILLDHVEKMKWDHFYEGLNSADSYGRWQNPPGYFDLLLATWKLESRTEARDPLAQNPQ